MSVLFPAPLGPTIPSAVPGGTCSDTPSSARTTRPRARAIHPPYSFSTPSSRIMGGSVRPPPARRKAGKRRQVTSARAAGKGEREGRAHALDALDGELPAHGARQVAADGE